MPDQKVAKTEDTTNGNGYANGTGVPKLIKKKKSAFEIHLFERVSDLDIAFSIRHLSTMLRSGLPLESAIWLLYEQTTNAKLKRTYADIMLDIQSGLTLAASMKKHENVFSEVIISAISIGEQGGTLEKNLIFLADFLKKQYALQKKVKGALTYPFVIFGITLLEMSGVLFFILPKITSLFAQFDNTPPLTRAVLNSASFVRENGLFILIGLVIFFFALGRFAKTRVGEKMFDKIALSFPIINKLNQFKVLSSFARTLGILMESGIPISKALEVSTETSDNVIYQEALVKVAEKVHGGQNLALSLEEYPRLFPVAFTKMIKIGEESGTLEENLKYLYEFYEEEVEDMSNNLSTLLEPILLVFIGAMIGILALVIVGPIYQLTGSING